MAQLTFNINSYRVLTGESTVVNKHLLRELTALEYYKPKSRNCVIVYGGLSFNVVDISNDKVKSIVVLVFQEIEFYHHYDSHEYFNH